MLAPLQLFVVDEREHGLSRQTRQRRRRVPQIVRRQAGNTGTAFWQRPTTPDNHNSLAGSKRLFYRWPC